MVTCYWFRILCSLYQESFHRMWHGFFYTRGFQLFWISVPSVAGHGAERRVAHSRTQSSGSYYVQASPTPCIQLGVWRLRGMECGGALSSPACAYPLGPSHIPPVENPCSILSNSLLSLLHSRNNCFPSPSTPPSEQGIWVSHILLCLLYFFLSFMVSAFQALLSITRTYCYAGMCQFFIISPLFDL